jgi:pimeloyl-ACP methyl ester carboxylesterase
VIDLHTTTLGDAGSRVLFCHGLFGQGKNWTQIARQLAVDHRVLLADMPNHGRSGWTEQFDYGEAADAVAALLDAPTALVGHSMGGKIAMLVALRHPELVERLCVVDVAPVAYDHHEEFRRYLDAMIGLDTDALASRAEADAALQEAAPSRTVRSFLLSNLHREGSGWRWRPNLEVLRDGLPALGGWPEDDLAGVATYDGRVLWLGGADSHYVVDEYEPAMQRWFPHTRRVTVKNAGHWVHSEQPAVVAEVLRQFLA